MKVAYYYNQEQFPKSDSRTNPYGPLLAEAMERLGVEFEFSLCFDAKWLLERRGDVQILHLNWPSYQYKRFRTTDRPCKVFRLWIVFLAKLLLARLFGYRLVWTMHNLYPHDRRYRLLDHLCRLALCRLCHAVIVHCEYANNLAAKHFGRKSGIYVIPHGHFFDVYPNEISREQARQRLGIPESHFVYLFFGSIQPYKGIDILVEAFSTLEGAGLNLMITGAAVTPYAHTVSAAAQKDKRIVLRLSERISSDDLQVYFNAADVVVFPFTAMLTSGSVILAMSFKKPVIVPTLGCLPELMTGDTGISYDPDNRDELRKAMEEIRTRDLQDMGEKAFQRVMNFSWEKIAALTLETYDRT